MFVVRIDVAVLPHAVVGATGGFLGVEHVVEERFGESARRGARAGDDDDDPSRRAR